LTDPSNPDLLNWADAPGQFRAAFDAQRNELDQARQQANANDTLTRENAMLRAGIDLDHPAASYFTAGYSGKLEVDDIKAEWEKIAGPPPGTPATPPAVPGPPVNADGSDPAVVAQLQDLQNQRNQLGNGAVAPGEEPTPDPQDLMIQEFHADRAAGRTRAQAEVLGYDRMVERAVAGDQRLVSNSATEATAKWRARNGFDE